MSWAMERPEGESDRETKITTPEVEQMFDAHPTETEWAIREGVVAPKDRFWGLEEAVEFARWLIWHRLRGAGEIDGVTVMFDDERVRRQVQMAWPRDALG